MSYGFIAKGASAGHVSAAVMRGPMVGKVVTQLLSGTDWGELDYLLVDLPPGTGDVHLTVSQTYSLTGALVVTTPQRLSRVDVLKGIDMWRELRVPVLSVIENMVMRAAPRSARRTPHVTRAAARRTPRALHYARRMEKRTSRCERPNGRRGERGACAGVLHRPSRRGASPVWQDAAGGDTAAQPRGG
eukprot:1434649-Prymnesium_polylepis.2